MTDEAQPTSTILWHSNAPHVNTGYGVESRIFGPRIAERLGYEVIFSSFYGLNGATIKYHGHLVVPHHVDMYGNDILSAHTAFFNADMVLTLMDVWALRPKIMRTLPWVAWLPIDHSPVPRPVVHTLDRGKGIPIAMSRFGVRELRKVGFDPLYVPHSPAAIYYEATDREKARQKFGWNDNFVVGMIAANKGFPCRKCFPEVFAAFSRLVRKHSDALLYVHAMSRSPYGMRLDLMLEQYKVPQKSVRFVDQYRYVVGMGSEYMKDAFTAIDVLANPSAAEGFGIPIAEAQACGTPVIVTDFSAMPELCGFGKTVGWTPRYTSQASFQAQPNTDEIYEAMLWAYNLSDSERLDGAEKAKKHMAAYHPDVVTDTYWKPVLLEAQKRLDARDDLQEPESRLIVDDDQIQMS